MQYINEFNLNEELKGSYKNLTGSSISLACADIAKRSNVTLIITNNSAEAFNLEEDLKYLIGENKVYYFPDWETLPYDTFSPYQDIISRRLEILSKLSLLKDCVVIISSHCAQTRVAPRTFVNQSVINFKIGDNINLTSFQSNLIDSGYILVKQVLEHGEFAIRGSIIDLFPMGSNAPFRIDLFDNEIDTIHTFDLETQRSIQSIEKINILPAHEFPTDDEAINTFRKNYRQHFKPNDISLHNIYQQISRKILPAGIEYYLPLFFENTETIFDYLSPDTQIILCNTNKDTLKEFFSDATSRAIKRVNNLDAPALDPQYLFLDDKNFYSKIEKFKNFHLFSQNIETRIKKVDTLNLPPLSINNQDQNPNQKLEEFIKEYQGKIFICSVSEGRRSILHDLIYKHIKNLNDTKNLNEFLASRKKITLGIAPFTQGFLTKDYAIITESELLGASYAVRKKRSRSRNINPDAIIKNLAELKVGDYVVHEQYGIAKYQGLETLKIDNIKGEFVKLIFNKEAKLFVPITSLHLLSRYLGKDEPELTKLGTESWKKARNKALNKIKDVAAQLLDIYAKREIKEGFAYKLNREEYNAFANGFGYQPTDDQEKAFDAVISDMTSNRPMDRLICGDVGFGKTEVAMRAAFIAASNSKQVAILVPTTLLADQHYDNFKERFANTPINIASVSRFNSASAQKKILDAANEGKIDILIGTHKLLSKNLKFKNLGLLIIDEEHRFGVSQKEKIKELRAEVDILTMTATPIPRTLNLAMNGVRDLSIIAQAPAKRLAVKTFVHEEDNNLIREAILRELKRGGQIYFLHNDVKTIEKRAQDLLEIIPEAKLAIAHAQLAQNELSKIMHDFYHQRINLLVCSTIIETGIDVPTANTIIIDRADKLGLAQLHQLRGRVGRSHHQAYAYLLTPPPSSLNPDSKKRLEAISSLEELGSGFILATHDLEIRGAGEILGSEQSGQIEGIGFNLYTEMLNDAIEAIKEGKDPNDKTIKKNVTQIELHIPVFLPDTYIFDVNTRLNIYKRLATCIHKDQIDDLKGELIDRFGPLPNEALNLIEITHLKLIAKKLGIESIEYNARSGNMAFSDKIMVDLDYLTKLITEHFDEFRPDGPKGLKLLHKCPEIKERLEYVSNLLNEMLEHYKEE